MFRKIIKKFRQKHQQHKDMIMDAKIIESMLNAPATASCTGVFPTTANISGWHMPLRGTSTRDARACYGPIGQKGVLITDSLITDILNNMQRVESLLWVWNE